jgi:hypothetical protein
MRFNDFIQVAPRFSRAVSLERDAGAAAAIDGYIVTSTAQHVIERLSRALSSATSHRAWTLTGPYGSGKSAFALYLANLLGAPQEPAGRLARGILRDQQQALFKELFEGKKKNPMTSGGFSPILVSGSPEPLGRALLRACCHDIKRLSLRGRPPKAFLDIERLHASAEKGKHIASSVVVEAIVSLAANLQESGRFNGILLIVDELGKFLEFAARAPEQGDVYLLQQLAEATARFREPALYFLTILHQSFDRYAANLRPAIRNEWTKVQGRFEDIAFQEPPDQFLDLVAHAVSRSSHPLTSALERQAGQLAETAWALGLAPAGMTRAAFLAAMTRSAPLHPLTVVILARLCRKLGQHQRSLFAFLVSREPHAFSKFLEQEVTKAHLPFYRVAQLYDYVAAAIGNGLSVGEGAARWAEIQAALDRYPDASSEQLEIIKTVGILSAVGAQGELKPSREIIRFALNTQAVHADTATKALLERSILVYRKHNQAFGLWQGSDIDIDVQLAEAKKRIPPSSSLAKKLSALWVPRPLVAKRHSFQTGTLRYFSLRFADLADFSKSLELPPDADGLIVYCLPTSQSEVEQLTELAANSPVREHMEILVAVPRDTTPLREAVYELELLRWVETHTPELKGDLVARREIRARIAVAERNVAREVESLFSPTTGSRPVTSWFHRGVPRHIADGRSLTHLLSDVCDVVYPHTPRLRNELINRRSLSSAAAKARRNLIEAMMTRGSDERLGIEGTPPEMSMYLSVLRSTGIHRVDESGYGFGEPQKDAHLREVWQACTHFFSTCELNRRPVSDLFSELQKAPHGLKMGVIPVLFCAAVLTYDTELAFYEEGAFVPELAVDGFERLLRSPERFELRRYRIVGVRRDVFRHFAKLVDAKLEEKEKHLVAIVRPLYRFLNRLPAYTKSTNSLSPITLAVRQALLSAKEPDALLFEDLPRACGAPPFPAANAKTKEVASFFRTLRNAFGDLQRFYDDLLAELQKLLCQAFNAKEATARELIRYRAQTITEHAVEPRLRAFLHHLADDQLGDATWIEAIATLLTGKAPQSWTDTDRARYEVGLSESVRAFRHIEALVFESANRERAGRAPADVLRIGVTDRHSKDREAVVAVDAEDQDVLAQAVIRLEESLDHLNVSSNAELSLAALATVARRFLAELEESKDAKPKLAVGVGRG